MANDDSTRLSQTSRAVWLGRVLFFGSLLAIASILGAATHHRLSSAETELSSTQFASIAERALVEAGGIARHARLTASTMATVVGHGLPDAAAWPYVTLPGFEDIATKMLRNKAGAATLGLVPFVTPDQQSQFEEFAQDYFLSSHLPPGTGNSSFGYGIWLPSAETGAPDNRVHDTMANRWGSPYEVFAPVVQMNEQALGGVMFNAHFDALRGGAVDRVIDCTEQLQSEGVQANDALQGCGSLTTFIQSFKVENQGPSALLFAPVFPANNPDTLVGVIGSLIVWDVLLHDIFADTVTGVDCVLESDQEAFTYSIERGQVVVRGRGDLHQTKYNGHRQSTVVTSEDMQSNSSPIYTLSLYPNDEFYNIYTTNNPKTATIGVICVVLAMSIAFFFYDSCVRREFTEKDDLLAAKRNFMRFVSHCPVASNELLWKLHFGSPVSAFLSFAGVS